MGTNRKADISFGIPRAISCEMRNSVHLRAKQSHGNDDGGFLRQSRERNEAQPRPCFRSRRRQSQKMKQLAARSTWAMELWGKEYGVNSGASGGCNRYFKVCDPLRGAGEAWVGTKAAVASIASV